MRYDKEIVKTDGRILRAGGPRDLQRRQQQAALSFDQRELVLELRKTIEGMHDELAKKPTVEGAFSAEEVDEEIRKAVEQAVKEVKGSSKKTVDNLQKEVGGFKKKEENLLDKIENLNNTHKKELQDTTQIEADKYTRVIEQIDEGYKRTIVHLEESLKLSEEKSQIKNDAIDILKSNIETLKDGGLGTDEFRKIEQILLAMAEGKEVIDPDRPKIEDVFIDPLDEKAGEGLRPHIVVDEDITEDAGEKVDDQVDKLKKLMKGLPNK